MAALAIPDDRNILYQDIQHQILSCTRCQLSTTRKHAVPGEGKLDSDLIFVGEGPGEQEDLRGFPFVGAAGKLLDQLIGSLGRTRPDVYITNLVKCRPPGNRDPLPQEIDACRIYLIAQIGLICPRVICTLGRHALHALINPAWSISSVHGRVVQKDGIFFFPTFHPAAALYHPASKNDLETDFLRLKDLLQEETFPWI
jgi:uracil-DNA glycosylase family 4